MRASLSKAFAWVSRNAGTIIAVSSLTVAMSALYVSVRTASTDLEYKEVSIQPRLWLGADWDRMAVELRNTGLGPALINGLAFARNGECITSTNKDRDQFTGELVNFLKESRDDLYSKTMPPTPAQKNGAARRYNVEIDAIGPGDVIRPGESIFLVRLAADNLSEVKTLPSDLAIPIKNKFAAAVFALPLQVRACSLTERTCGLTGNQLPAACKNIP